MTSDDKPEDDRDRLAEDIDYLRTWSAHFAVAGSSVAARILRVLGHLERVENLETALAARCHGQSELLSQRAEVPPPIPVADQDEAA